MFHAIGLVEFSSIAKGIEASDVMAKTAEVRILVSKAICPGKYIVLVGGDIAAVQQSVRSATIEAADAAVKAAKVEPVRMHLAFGIGGKSYVVMTGDVADIEAGVRIGSEVAGSKGMLVQRVVIPRPHKQVIEHLM